MSNVSNRNGPNMHLSRTRRLADTVMRFAADTRGATAIEYALIAAGVGAAIAATVYSLGTQMQTKYNTIDNAIQ